MWKNFKWSALVIKDIILILFRGLVPVALWLATAWYLDISLTLTLLTYIAVNLTKLGLFMSAAADGSAEHKQPERDFYVLINADYKWNPLTSSTRSTKIQPSMLDDVLSFDSFEPAKLAFEAMSREHYPYQERSPWLDNPDLYMNGENFEEYDARLWVIPALTKQDAFNEAFYDDKRRLLGYGSGALASHLILFTDNTARRSEYRAWWSQRRAYQRYLSNRETYLQDHTGTLPKYLEPLEFGRWAANDKQDWSEISNPGRPAQ